jgi:predicted N-formylglutamate amidohydrolase
MLRYASRTEAVEVVAGSPDARVLFTCEHATQRMPPGWAWPDADRRLIDTHWAYDPGARELACDLAVELDAVAVLSRFTRLLVDPNRPEDSDTLFRALADGAPILLNTAFLDASERARRIEQLHRPYHAAIDRELGASRAPLVFALHTFTPVYEGQRRTLEIGVLFDREEALAESLHEALRASGFAVELNEPYSGKGGLMHAADVHAQAHGRRALELEVRQDLATDPLFRRQLHGVLARWL